MFNFQALVDWDDTVLDGVNLVPAGIDQEILKSEIMIQCGLLQPLYPEPETMKAAIKQWFSARQWTFQHLLNIIAAEYSPIENTDRYDTQTRTIERALDRTDNETGSRTESRSNSRDTESEVSTTGETIGTVAAFNSDVWQNSDKNNSSGTTNGTENVTGTDSLQGSDTRRNVADEDENTSETFTQHMHGNIGVTTNQEMITQELALLADFNIYTWIAMNLRDSLFLEVY